MYPPLDLNNGLTSNSLIVNRSCLTHLTLGPVFLERPTVPSLALSDSATVASSPLVSHRSRRGRTQFVVEGTLLTGSVGGLYLCGRVAAQTVTLESVRVKLPFEKLKRARLNNWFIAPSVCNFVSSV